MQFSVIVLLYNSEKTALEKTLKSIAEQNDISYEIILADDGSTNDCLQWARTYLDRLSGITYKISSHKNVGTVENINLALNLAAGKYVKCIGAGDMLFNKNTLRDIYTFMLDSDCAMCFGKMQGYREKDSGTENIIIECPADIKSYIKQDIPKMKKNIIQNHGWIVGASMFYNTAKFKEYLQEIRGTVRFCEDLLQVLLLIKGESIQCYEKGAVWYEVGTGISTDNSVSSNTRMKNDHDNFWNYMQEKYGNIQLVKKGIKMYQYQSIKDTRKRQFTIILRNPSYVIMLLKTKLQIKSYMCE